ncbi:MAG: hypothetical protein GXP55_06420 [Deltaproteobacteria bacterium]|nr:hypothetical protein [Deltaproteobacteria bacterium]
MAYVPGKRLTRLLFVVALYGLAILALSWNVSARRAREAARRESTRAVVALLGFADLALSSDARWLRHPSQTEPGAAFADLPGALDIDPAGAAIGPPLPLLERGGCELRVVHRGAP